MSQFITRAAAGEVNAAVPSPETRRLAKLIADGEVPFPDDLSCVEVHELARIVRECRRTRLLSFLAQQVAIDLLRDSK